jgi:integrase
MAKRTANDYVFAHPQSRNLFVRLSDINGRRYVKSLGTTDRAVAEIIALPLIAHHKAIMLARRPVPADTVWRRDYAPGLHDAPDGGKIYVTDREIHYIDKDGITRGRSPKDCMAFVVAAPSTRPVLAVKNSDDSLFETYLAHKNITGDFEREARGVWALFKTLTGSKLLKDCDRDDGRLLVAHYTGQGLKSATVRKKIGWLRSAVNLAIREGKLKFNPFSSIVPKKDDEEERWPFDDADIQAIHRGLEGLAASKHKSDVLLLRVLASTGMRLGEAFEIDHELVEDGCRYVIIGTKTPQSKRRVPLPAGVLPYLPELVKGSLFAGTEKTASKRLNRFLRKVGITDTAKTVHSFRHRATDRLRRAACPDSVRFELLGHEKKTIAAGYGRGSPVPLLRQWCDRIGF